MQASLCIDGYARRRSEVASSAVLPHEHGSPLIACRLKGISAVPRSNTDLRQCDALGPPLLALAYLSALKRALRFTPEALATSCHDDTFLRAKQRKRRNCNHLAGAGALSTL